MKADERRNSIMEMLMREKKAIKGTTLAESFNVTRQIIVKDIAILRAEGNLIIATPDGYILNKQNEGIRKIIAVSHNEDRLVEELDIIIKYGGTIEDVIVEHPIYGEIKGLLMISSLHDLNNFISKYKANEAKLLSLLTNGVHIHTIITDNEESMNLILKELKEKGFIIE